MPYEALQKKIVGLPALPDGSLVAERLSKPLEHLDRLQQRHDDIVKRLDNNVVERRGVINHQLNPRSARVEYYLLGETQAKKAHRKLEEEKNIIIREVAPVGREISNVLRDANLEKDIQADIANFESRKLAKENEKKEAEKDANNAFAVAILSREIEKLEQGIIALKKFLDEIKDEKNITKMTESVNKFVTDRIRSGISAADVVEASEKMMTLGAMNAKEKVADSQGVIRIAKKYTGADGKVHTADYEKTKDGVTSKIKRSRMKKDRFRRLIMGSRPGEEYMGAAERKARNEIDYNTYEEEGIDTSHQYDFLFYSQETDEDIKEWHQKNFGSFVDCVLVKSNEELSSVRRNPDAKFKDEYMVFDPALQVLEADKPEAERSSKYKKYLKAMWTRNNQLHDNNFNLTSYKYHQTLLLGEVNNKSTFPQAVNAKNAAYRAKHHAELARNFIQQAIDKLPERYTSVIELATHLQELDAARATAQQACDSARSVAKKMRAEYEHQKSILPPDHPDLSALLFAVEEAEKAVSAADLKLAEADKIRTQLTRPVAPDLQTEVKDSIVPSPKLLEALVPIVLADDDSVKKLATIIVDAENSALPAADRTAAIIAMERKIKADPAPVVLINQALKFDPKKAMQVLEVAHKKLLDRTAPDVEDRIIDIFATIENGAAGLVALNQNTAGTAAEILQADQDGANEIIVHASPDSPPHEISNVTKAVAAELEYSQESSNGVVSYDPSIAAETVGQKANASIAVHVLKHSKEAQDKITKDVDHKPMAQVFYTSAAARRTLKDSAVQLKVLQASLEGRNVIAKNPDGIVAVSGANDKTIAVTASVLAQDIHQNSARAVISHSDTATRAGARVLVLDHSKAEAKLRASTAGLSHVINDPMGVLAVLQASLKASKHLLKKDANSRMMLAIAKVRQDVCAALASKDDCFQLIAQSDSDAVGRVLAGLTHLSIANSIINTDLDFVCGELARDLESFLEIAAKCHDGIIPVNATEAERAVLLKQYFATDAEAFRYVSQPTIREPLISRVLARRPSFYSDPPLTVNQIINRDLDFVCDQIAEHFGSFSEIAAVANIPLDATKAERVVSLKQYFTVHPNAFDHVSHADFRYSLVSGVMDRQSLRSSTLLALDYNTKLNIVIDVLRGEHGLKAINELYTDPVPETYEVLTDAVDGVFQGVYDSTVAKIIIDSTDENTRREMAQEALKDKPKETINHLSAIETLTGSNLAVDAFTIVLRENSGRALDDMPAFFKTEILKDALKADSSAINAQGVTGGAKLDITTTVFKNSTAAPLVITRLNSVNVQDGLPLIGQSTPILDEAIDVAFNVSTRVEATAALVSIPSVYDSALKAGLDSADSEAIINGLREVPQDLGNQARDYLTPALSEGLQANKGSVFAYVNKPELRTEILARTLHETAGKAFAGVTNERDRTQLLTTALLTTDEAGVKGGAINSVTPAIRRQALTPIVKLPDPVVQNHINTILSVRTPASIAANQAITALASIVSHVDHKDPEAIDGLTDILTNQYMRDNPSEDREVITDGIRNGVIADPEGAIRDALAIQDIETLSVLVTAYDQLIESNPATPALAVFVNNHPASEATIRALSSATAGNPITPEHIDQARKKDSAKAQEAIDVATALANPALIGTAIDAHPKAKKVGEIVIADATETIKAAKSKTPLTKVVDDIELEISAKALSAEENKASPHIMFATKRIIKALHNLNLDPAMRAAMLLLGTPPITQEMVAKAIEENPYQVFRNIQGSSSATAVSEAIKNTVTPPAGSNSIGLSDAEIRDMAKIDLEVISQLIEHPDFSSPKEIEAIAKLIPSPPAEGHTEKARLKSALALLDKSSDLNKRRDALMAAMSANPKKTRRAIDKILDDSSKIFLIREIVLKVVGDPIEAINQSSRIKDIRSDFTKSDPATGSAELTLNQERQRVLSHAKTRLINKNPAVIEARANAISRPAIVMANFAYFSNKPGFENIKMSTTAAEIAADPDGAMRKIGDAFTSEQRNIIDKEISSNPSLKDKVPEVAFAISKVDLMLAEEEAKSIDILAAGVTSRHNIDMVRTSITNADSATIDIILADPAARQALVKMLLVLDPNDPSLPDVGRTEADILAALQPSLGIRRTHPRVLFSNTKFNEAARQLPEVVAAVLDKRQPRSPGVTLDIVRRVDAQIALETAQDKFINDHRADYDKKIEDAQASIFQDVAENNKSNALFNYYVRDTTKLPLVSEDDGSITIKYQDQDGRAPVKLSPDEVRAAVLKISKYYDDSLKGFISTREKMLNEVQYTLDSEHADFRAVNNRLKGLRSIVDHDGKGDEFSAESRELLASLLKKVKAFSNDLEETGVLGQRFVKPSKAELDSAEGSVTKATEDVVALKKQNSILREDAVKDIINRGVSGAVKADAGGPIPLGLITVDVINGTAPMPSTIGSEIQQARARDYIKLINQDRELSKLRAKVPAASYAELEGCIEDARVRIFQSDEIKMAKSAAFATMSADSTVVKILAAVASAKSDKNTAALDLLEKIKLGDPAASRISGVSQAEAINILAAVNKSSEVNQACNAILDTKEESKKAWEKAVNEDATIEKSDKDLAAAEEIEKTAKEKLAKLEGVKPFQTSLKAKLTEVEKQGELAKTKAAELEKKPELIKESKKTNDASQRTWFGYGKN